MKHLTILLFVLFNISLVNAQETPLIVEQERISDLSPYPIYSRLIQDNHGKTEWKDEYRYLDSIDIYSLTYLSDGLRIKGLMAKPKGTGIFPCIIFNRGGNREFGSLTIASGVMTLGSIAKEGYVVIASQYRGCGGSEGIEEFGGSDVNDVLILTEVLKEIEGADPERIGMYGWSRGGMMTYIALSKTTKIKAAVVGGGLSDVFEVLEDRPEMEIVATELIPNYAGDKINALTQRSAIKWADQFKKDVPVLLMHGNADWRVKPEQSLRLALEFEKYRIPYRLIMFEGADHGITEHRAEVNGQVIHWFDRYLKRKEPVPNMEYHGK